MLYLFHLKGACLFGIMIHFKHFFFYLPSSHEGKFLVNILKAENVLHLKTQNVHETTG